MGRLRPAEMLRGLKQPCHWAETSPEIFVCLERHQYQAPRLSQPGSVGFLMK